ncbi:hypothetical protein HYH02_007773 [Chlamydomonas schloesseri]|uniref:FAD dependent oxidoreductase domain-containing protein n=1 Tax=Chlamydomonas schloesseri TaxID=2026947 RepID=A0A835WH58_9CHLO|nr:hypothetical protein HYH02_007773 [Chlamydomonas schloesseri]|eukprot:KAG2447448.1 hypothetical protein HYH02_007773 [Chlamydomonas schloesseri]
MAALNVAVVGGGIVGAAIANAASRVGAKVRVLDVEPRPGCGGSTRSTWAWLNAQKKLPEHYRDLNVAGLQRWKADWPHLVHNCGSLVFGDDDEASLGDAVYPALRLGASQVLEREPAVAPGMAARGANLWAQEAWVDPQAACAAMLAAAEARGAEVLLGPGQRVERLQVEAADQQEQQQQQQQEHGWRQAGSGRRRVTGVVTADGRVHGADVVVLAAGAACGPLAAGAGVQVPLLHKPAVIALTQPLPGPPLTRHLLSSEEVFAFQRPDGSYILGDTRAHEDGSRAWGESLLARATALVPGLAERGARIEAVEVAYRPWPKDGHPIIGPAAAVGCLGLYVATMHSGMTLAPHVAELVAAELRHWRREAGVAEGEDPQLLAAQGLLAPYRLERAYDAGVVAYGWKQ